MGDLWERKKIKCGKISLHITVQYIMNTYILRLLSRANGLKNKCLVYTMIFKPQFSYKDVQCVYIDMNIKCKEI